MRVNHGRIWIVALTAALALPQTALAGAAARGQAASSAQALPPGLPGLLSDATHASPLAELSAGAPLPALGLPASPAAPELALSPEASLGQAALLRSDAALRPEAAIPSGTPALQEAEPARQRATASERVAGMGEEVTRIAQGAATHGGAENGHRAGRAFEGVITGSLLHDAPSAADPVAADPASLPPALDFAGQVASFQPMIKAYRERFGRAVVGQTGMRDGMLIALLAGGHVLLEGVPGVAKTRSVLTFSRLIDLAFKRVQFTRDLLPFDITGQEEKNRRNDEWEIRRGPIFNNVLLADEVNRAKAQTQGALLEAMEERQVTIAGQTIPLPKPFMVLATQNDLNDEGTNPLPRAQLDRFMFKVKVPYLKEAELVSMLDLTLGENGAGIEPVMTQAQVLEAQDLSRRVLVSQEIKRYIARLMTASRPKESQIDAIKKYVKHGGSDRAAQVLARAAQARAFLEGRAAVLPEDVKAVAHWVLAHRLILNFEGESKTTPEAIVDALLAQVAVAVAGK